MEQIPVHHQSYLMDSFMCPLSKNVMLDPVAIFCGHSFERKAIQQHFDGGEKRCPTCNQELPSLELMSNLLLRRSIREWNQRDMETKFQNAILGIASNDHLKQDEALEDMQKLMELPHYALRIADEGVTSKLVAILKGTQANTIAALKCLYYIAKYCESQRETIVEAGALRHIVKTLFKSKTESVALELLFELSEEETLRDKIGNTKDCIPLLVSLLSNHNHDVSKTAHKVLQNLSSNIHFVVKTAKAGNFQPFVDRFNEASQETRAMMAAALRDMQLKENNIEDLNNKQFIHNLTQMLSSSAPAFRMASLKSTKRLITYTELVKQFLEDPVTIPHLLGLISFVRSDQHLEQEAAEVLALLIKACEHTDFQKYQGLQELQSEHNISLLLQLAASSVPESKIQYLHMLVELVDKSETAKRLIQSDMDAVSHLFSSLQNEQPEVRRWAMKLIHCISEDHHTGVPLPPSPGKEAAINILTDIFTYSPDMEERYSAAGIISLLPRDDTSIDEILCKSEVLKAIHEVICTMDVEYDGNKKTSHIRMSLLENTLAALIRYAEPSKPKLRKQVGMLELHSSLVRVLSRGSSLAKKQAAIALAKLSESTMLSIYNANIEPKQERKFLHLLPILKRFPSMPWCCTASQEHETESICCIHGDACSPRDTFCLIKVDAVKPLIQSLKETETGVAEAAFMALETLLIDQSTLIRAATAIVDSHGVAAILHVLESSPISAKMKALDLLQKILRSANVADSLLQRLEAILIQLLHEDALKKKVALTLQQMNVIPEQSSYF